MTNPGKREVSRNKSLGGHFKFLISIQSPDFLFFMTGFHEQGSKELAEKNLIPL
jgi:hypothetical protein